jgi:hemerythrin-like metal-binding protein
MGYLASQETQLASAGPIAHEHALLVEAINETCASLSGAGGRDPVLDALGLLYVRICAHFALEERMVRQSSPELYSAHKIKYEALLERIRVMMDAFYEGECDACEKSLKDCLLSWLDQHLQTEHPRARISPA